MRILNSLFISAAIVIGLFYLIIGLIHQDIPPLELKDERIQVNIEEAEKEEPEQEAQSQKVKEEKQEPVLVSEIQPSPSLANNQQPLININLTPTDFKFQSNNIPKLQENWIQPTAAQVDAQALGDQLGAKPKALRKVIPVSTRKPQIPKIAWENKINGWVMISVEVTPFGKTENIQIIDASPRGIFEDSAVEAVKRWRYAGFKGSNRSLLQKIEFEWKDYPLNWE